MIKTIITDTPIGDNRTPHGKCYSYPKGFIKQNSLREKISATIMDFYNEAEDNKDLEKTIDAILSLIREEVKKCIEEMDEKELYEIQQTAASTDDRSDMACLTGFIRSTLLKRLK
jgi:hypothetical protein